MKLQASEFICQIGIRNIIGIAVVTYGYGPVQLIRVKKRADNSGFLRLAYEGDCYGEKYNSANKRLAWS